MINVAICVCTRNRPKMFAECLESLMGQIVDHNEYDVSIVVVDNNLVEDVYVRMLIEHKNEISPFPITYVREAMTGIASARNAGVKRALMEYGADFIAMIDDDEVAECDWLIQLLDAQEKYNADIVYGQVNEIFPEPRAKWIVPRKAIDEVKIGCKYAPTNCTLFKCSTIFRDGMHFNEAYNLSGGSDSELTRRAYEKGAMIVKIPFAIVTETISPERCTLAWYIGRSYRVEAVNTRIDVELYGWRKAAIKRFPKVFTQILKGFVKVNLALLTISRKRYMKAAKNYAHAVGILAGLTNRLPQPYKHTVGE